MEWSSAQRLFDRSWENWRRLRCTSKEEARENDYVESFNGKMREEFLNREQIDTLREAKVLHEQWRRHYNTERPHSSLGYKPPAPELRRTQDTATIFHKEHIY